MQRPKKYTISHESMEVVVHTLASCKTLITLLRTEGRKWELVVDSHPAHQPIHAAEVQLEKDIYQLERVLVNERIIPEISK